VLEFHRRPLKPSEMRLLRARIRSQAARRRRASKVYFPIVGVIILALWLWTVLASDASLVFITAFWLIVGCAITLWVRRDIRRLAGNSESMVGGLESALRRNAADVYDVRARAFAEFEEVEDEGACYAFELEGDRLVFVVGQEFYSRARFPSLDFSLVYILDESGRTVDMLIDKRGPRTAPARTIPAAVKGKIDIPQHLETQTGRIDDLAGSLGVSSETKS
jgi:hypothetical protein